MKGYVDGNRSIMYEVGDRVRFRCLSGLMPTEIMTSVCSVSIGGKSVWKPNPYLLICYIPQTSCVVQDATGMFKLSIIF